MQVRTAARNSPALAPRKLPQQSVEGALDRGLHGVVVVARIDPHRRLAGEAEGDDVAANAVELACDELAPGGSRALSALWIVGVTAVDEVPHQLVLVDRPGKGFPW